MRISGRKKKEQNSPDFVLLQAQEREKYDLPAALGGAVLLFMLAYGAIGGFLSAFGIAYDNGLCMAALLGEALLISLAYETDKKWLYNLSLVAVFYFGLVMSAVLHYWAVNSGYYAILNRILEEARDYLFVDSGVEYSLAVEETYTAVTMFVLFLETAAVVLFAIMLHKRHSLAKIAVLTLTPFAIPLYLECAPSSVCVILLLTAYLTLALQEAARQERVSKHRCYLMLFAALLAVSVVRLAALLLPENVYDSAVSKNMAKAASEDRMAAFAQYGMRALTMQAGAGAGISGGRLNRGPGITPSYETMLKVRYTPYDYGAVYLKAFTGRDYLGDRWTQAEPDLPDDGEMRTTVNRYLERYRAYMRSGGADGILQGRGVMEVEVLDPEDTYEYRPYYADAGVSVERGGTRTDTYIYYPPVVSGDAPSTASGDSMSMASEDSVSASSEKSVSASSEKSVSVSSETSVPTSSEDSVSISSENFSAHDGDAPLPDDWFGAGAGETEISGVYLYVPASCRDAVASVCAEAGFAGSVEEISAQIVDYFQENYSYTLRPGYYFGGDDYISHFLLDGKKGYCAHFASAATMLFRQMGIPARYVEGYAFSYYNITENGELAEDGVYSDYYSGYAPLGETALVEIAVPDAYAHAWVEIYVEGQGWTVVDATPTQTVEGETPSFWENFRNGGGRGQDDVLPQNRLGEYLEGALNGVSYVVVLLTAVAAAALGITFLRRRYRESRLTDREKVQLAYGRLWGGLARRYAGCRQLHTLHGQLEWLRERCGVVVSGEQEEALYQAFFARKIDCDCQELCRELYRLRKMLFFRRLQENGRKR